MGRDQSVSAVRYRIGIDVGDRSVGLAAIAYDDSGIPIEILSAVSHIHDGGMDPDTGKSPQSRLATSGVARRTRRLVRNRRRRLALLDEVLQAHGIPVPSDETPQTYEAWDARARLVNEFVPNAEERLTLVSLAVRHLARHRGWRNPWWGFDRLAEATVPSEHFAALLEKAQIRFAVPPSTWRHLGELASATASTSVALRPRTATRPGLLATSAEGAVISHQIQQEDSLAELIDLLTMQKVPADAFDGLCRAVFHQTKPHVPLDRVGRDSLPGMTEFARAPLAVLEFQEFRIRAAVANLRIRVDQGARELTPAEYDRVVANLLTWRKSEPPRWIDVADWLEVKTRELKRPSIDEDGGGSVAPFDRTSRTIEAAFKKTSQVGVWWAEADASTRSEFIALVADSVTSATSLSDSVTQFAETWSAKTLQKVDALAFESGRAAYSRQSLERLVSVMAGQRCDVHQARKIAFGVDDSWQPPGPTFDDKIEHPTVSRVNALVRRYLSTAVARWGLPEKVVVEHVRSSFMGPAARAEYLYEMTSNTRRRDEKRAELTAQGVQRPSSGDLRRYEAVQRQNGVCLYCGAMITLATCELDHIIANAEGGSNRRDNLVAVCKTCNGQKGKLPFAVFVKQSNRAGVSIEDARTRLRSWPRQGMTVAQHRRFIADVSRRLGLDEDPDGEMVRSIESTAYAAREMRGRVDSYLAAEAGRRGISESPKAVVYAGSITSQARKAGGVDERLRLRGKDVKSRYDRRHHAIDAAVLTTLNDGVARTLQLRNEQFVTHRFTGKVPDWKEFEGRTPGEMGTYATWRSTMASLAVLLEAEAQADRISVVRPLRLVPRVGLVHKATVEPLMLKPIGDSFTPEEILRVCNRRMFSVLTELAADSDGLAPDSVRANVLGVPQDGMVELYPSNSAYLRIRGGAAALGDTVQHARIYAWRSKAGFSYGMVRMYTGEFPKIGFAQPGIDVMTAPLPAYSQAMRCASPSLRARILSGDARQIGWLTIDDEIEIDVAALRVGDTKVAKFLQAEPEQRWIVTGFYDPARVSLAPAQLAFEGVSDTTPNDVAEILKVNRIPLAVNVVLGGTNVSIIRRTVLGRPRWSGSGLPISWIPEVEAAKSFAK